MIDEPDPVPAPPRWRWRRSALWLALEVVLITGGVFLALAVQQWAEERDRAEQAKSTLRWFRDEVARNREDVAGKLAYHQMLADKLRPYARTDARSRGELAVDFNGLQPPLFVTAAWDLALARQSLAYIDRDLAFSLSSIYMFQRMVDGQTKAVTEAMFMRPPWEIGRTFFLLVEPYYSDLIAIEPELLKMYDAVLPQIDEALRD